MCGQTTEILGLTLTIRWAGSCTQASGDDTATGSTKLECNPGPLGGRASSSIPVRHLIRLCGLGRSCNRPPATPGHPGSGEAPCDAVSLSSPLRHPGQYTGAAALEVISINRAHLSEMCLTASPPKHPARPQLTWRPPTAGCSAHLKPHSWAIHGAVFAFFLLFSF